MELLVSNYQPLKTSHKSFEDTFYSLLSESNQLDIAVGYITADSLSELKKILELNLEKKINLTIGMHFIDKFTELEYRTALDLHEYLTAERRGEVRLVYPFRYHGKLYVYGQNNNPTAAIIGSNNLSSIVGANTRVYETSVLIKDSRYVKQVHSFIRELNQKSTKLLSELEISDFKQNNELLENHEHVLKVPETDVNRIKKILTETTFEIPLKDTPKSNLNVFFGKGREAKNGLIKPRHWYEVELIVPRDVTENDGYPQSKSDEAEFDVVTDDGWKFKCKVSGDYSKNLRSAHDLKILGKWIKGRLEFSGALCTGNPVTQDAFNRYGRSSFTLTKTKEEGLWYLDFGVRK